MVSVSDFLIQESASHRILEGLRALGRPFRRLWTSRETCHEIKYLPRAKTEDKAEQEQHVARTSDIQNGDCATNRGCRQA